MSPRLSVLLPVYDERADFLERAIGSVLAQSMGDFELLLADDGSARAETRAALERAAAADARVRWLRFPHRGLTVTLNSGLAECRAELVARHDSDDWSEPDRFSLQAAFMDAHPRHALAGSQAWTHQENGAALWVTDLPTEPADVLRAFPHQNPFIHGSTMFRREAARSMGGYRAELDSSEDYDFFWRLCERFSGANLPSPLYHHRRTAGSISTRRAGEQSRAARITRILAQMRERGEADEFGRALERVAAQPGDVSAPAEDLLRNADGLLIAGRYGRALGQYARAVAAAPLAPGAWLKLARWAAFIAVPPLRRRLFAGAATR